MFNDTRFGVEVFYMHVRGVDVLMVLSYMHILKKIYIKNALHSFFDVHIPKLHQHMLGTEGMNTCNGA